MPGGDKTGPEGLGPATGRRAGFCAGFDSPGYTNVDAGRGFRGAGRGVSRGGGKGWRNIFKATGIPGWARFGSGFQAPVPAVSSKEQEIDLLKNQATYFENILDEIHKRIDGIDENSEKE